MSVGKYLKGTEFRVKDKIDADSTQSTKLMLEDQDRTIIFENVTGGKAVGNLFSTRQKVAEALNIGQDVIVTSLIHASDNTCDTEFTDEPEFRYQSLPVDLMALPICKYFPEDGGRYISSGIIGDESGSASFTVWENPPELEKGAVYRFNGCYTRKWNDKVQINIGQRGTITRADDVKIDLPERNLSLSVSEIKIGEIKENSGSVTVTGRILTSESRQVTVKGEPKTVYSGLIADDTGKIQFSAWNDYGLKEGETVCVKNAYIRSWQGIPQLNLGDRCEVCRVDDTFDDTAIGTSTERTIGYILKNGGGLDITLRGTVVDIKAGSGLIKRCPICNRSILDTGCSAHGMQDEPIPDLRMKLSVDDGTGSINAIMNRDITEKLTDITLKMAIDLSKARGPGMVATEMAPKILMKRIKIRGNVKIDDFGPTMIVTEAEPDKVDIEAEATKLLKEVEAKI